MKRWAVLTVGMYMIALLLVTTPAFLLGFAGWAPKPEGIGSLFYFYSLYGSWIWLAVLATGQALLLLVPIHIAERRPPPKRPVQTLAIVTAFFLANLMFAGAISFGTVVVQDDVWWNDNHLANFPNIALVCAVVFWIIWAVVFRRVANTASPEAIVNRSVRWLLRGSILELLIAVPSHIIVRRRDECCAQFITFWGIATGISVMLLCFGPGVYFLFVERFRRLQSRGKSK